MKEQRRLINGHDFISGIICRSIRGVIHRDTRLFLATHSRNTAVGLIYAMAVPDFFYPFPRIEDFIKKEKLFLQIMYLFCNFLHT